MESVIKDALKTSTLKPTGYGGGGCINEGEAYHTDQGKVFVKQNSKSVMLTRREWLMEANYLIVGDSRCRILTNRNIAAETGFQRINVVSKSRASYIWVLKEIEKRLLQGSRPDFVILFTLHCDFTEFVENENWKVKVLTTKDVSVQKMCMIHAYFISRWYRRYPEIRVIMTLPAVPDFKKYNLQQLQRLGTVTAMMKEWVEKHAKKEEEKYMETCNRFMEKWGDFYKRPPFPLSRLCESDASEFEPSKTKCLHWTRELAEIFWEEFLPFAKYSDRKYCIKGLEYRTREVESMLGGWNSCLKFQRDNWNSCLNFEREVDEKLGAKRRCTEVLGNEWEREIEWLNIKEFVEEESEYDSEIEEIE